MNITVTMWKKPIQTQKENLLYGSNYMKVKNRKNYSLLLKVKVMVAFGEEEISSNRERAWGEHLGAGYTFVVTL